ncbi:MAG: PTS galactitol transporter subunit IIC [Actinobacteria bacterium]|nr:PTS galactitol transporter subunit IIC [Actinomycetota bacterium]
MQRLFELVQYILGLGPSLMMPIIIAILGLAFGQKLSRAIRSGLFVGFGFIGINLVVGLMWGALSGASQAMVKRFGLQLTAVDMGWPVAAAISWGIPLSAAIIPVAIGLNLLLLWLRWTKTLNIDIWNFWHFAYITALTVAVSQSPLLGLVMGGIYSVIYLKLADWTAPQLQEVFDLPGISCTTGSVTELAPIAYVIDKIVDKIPVIGKLNANPDSIKDRFGVLGEPPIMGLVLGAIIGVIAGFNPKEIGTLSMSMGATLLILPRMVELLMEGLVPISEAAKELLSKRFAGRSVYIGMDAALAIGHPAAMSTALLMIPITLILAVILPGNKVLPFVDLAAMPFFMIFGLVFNRGNIIRGVINGTIFMIVALYGATAFAPLVTQVGAQAGYKIPQGTTTITQLGTGLHWMGMVLVKIAQYIAG